MKNNYFPVLTPEQKALLDELGGIPSFKYQDPNTGKIIFHAPAIPNTHRNMSNSAKIGLALLTIGLLGIGVISISIILAKEKKNNKRLLKELREQKEKEARNEYYSLINNYMTNVQEGTLSVSDIVNLANFFNYLIKSRRLGDITINLSKEEITVLYGIVLKITKEICSANNVLLEEKYDEIDSNNDENRKFEAILELLNVQQRAVSTSA